MRNRYDWLYRLVRLCQPQTLAEIGVHEALRGEMMSHVALAASPAQTIQYTGFDLWEQLENHEEVYNGKGPAKRAMAEQRLARASRKSRGRLKTQLVQGDHADTVPQDFTVDFVFIDGDHRAFAVQRDYDRVRLSTTIVLDDWYEPALPGLGCNTVICEPGCEQFILASRDRERWSGHQTSLLLVTRSPAIAKAVSLWPNSSSRPI